MIYSLNLSRFLTLVTMTIFGLGCYEMHSDEDGDSAANPFGTDGEETSDDDDITTPPSNATDDSDVSTEGTDGADFEPELYCPSQPRCDQSFCDQVLIPAGVFTMGSNTQPQDEPSESGCIQYEYGDETPAHRVRLDAFCIDKYEVTSLRYNACVHAGVCTGRVNSGELPDPSYDNGVARMDVGYNEAFAYCNWIGRRLCTEAEWERAASGPGPEKRKYPWGDTSPDEVCINDPTSRVASCPDGASAEGVFNMSGNVLEWVSDYYAPYDPPAGEIVENPLGPEIGDYRIARGGCRDFPSHYTTTERLLVATNVAESLFDEW